MKNLLETSFIHSTLEWKLIPKIITNGYLLFFSNLLYLINYLILVFFKCVFCVMLNYTKESSEFFQSFKLWCLLVLYIIHSKKNELTQILITREKMFEMSFCDKGKINFKRQPKWNKYSICRWTTVISYHCWLIVFCSGLLSYIHLRQTNVVIKGYVEGRGNIFQYFNKQCYASKS